MAEEITEEELAEEPTHTNADEGEAKAEPESTEPNDADADADADDVDADAVAEAEIREQHGFARIVVHNAEGEIDASSATNEAFAQASVALDLCTKPRSDTLIKQLNDVRSDLAIARAKNDLAKSEYLEKLYADLDKYDLTDHFGNCVIEPCAEIGQEDTPEEGNVIGYSNPIMLRRKIVTKVRDSSGKMAEVTVVSKDGKLSKRFIDTTGLVAAGLELLIEGRRSGVLENDALQGTLKAVFAHEQVKVNDIPHNWKWEQKDGVWDVSFEVGFTANDFGGVLEDVKNAGKLTTSGALAVGAVMG